jgi:queuine tRNA-ribosyltransferase
MSRFTIKKQDGRARLGSYLTDHGAFETPNFMPVGTQGTVKGIDCGRLVETGAQILLVNTYHLWLRPGEEIVRGLGGIHKFMNWGGPVLSDSGGFQVFSLSKIRTITEEGIKFRSHIDGSELLLTPEKSIQIQQALGVDIAMVLDECPKAESTYEEFRSSLELTKRWAKRCLVLKERESMFGITQGGFYKDLRTESAQFIGEQPFDGCAIGGLSVGEPQEVMYEVLSYHPEQLPKDKIRYLMGVGTPLDLITAVSNGVDLFDCVMPTRSGRFGRAFVSGPEPTINIRNARFIRDPEPLDPNCSCLACKSYSKGYIHHLFRADEMLGPILLSLHNTTFYQSFMKSIREAILTGCLEALLKAEQARWVAVGNLA